LKEKFSNSRKKLSQDLFTLASPNPHRHLSTLQDSIFASSLSSDTISMELQPLPKFGKKGLGENLRKK
jgi:hypothetical protein